MPGNKSLRDSQGRGLHEEKSLKNVMRDQAEPNHAEVR